MAAGWLEKAKNHAERGGFAGTVGTEQTKNLPGWNFQVEIIQGTKSAIILGQMLGA
jgi:hypothetical protein